MRRQQLQHVAGRTRVSAPPVDALSVSQSSIHGQLVQQNRSRIEYTRNECGDVMRCDAISNDRQRPRGLPCLWFRHAVKRQKYKGTSYQNGIWEE